MSAPVFAVRCPCRPAIVGWSMSRFRAIRTAKPAPRHASAAALSHAQLGIGPRYRRGENPGAVEGASRQPAGTGARRGSRRQDTTNRLALRSDFAAFTAPCAGTDRRCSVAGSWKCLILTAARTGEIFGSTWNEIGYGKPRCGPCQPNRMIERARRASRAANCHRSRWPF
jgi:integrase